MTAGSVIDSYTVGGLRLQIFAATSDCAQHPTVTVIIPDGWHILGGGAFVDWEDGVCTGPGSPGNLLTAMYPISETVWQVDSKDHLQPSPAQITGYCIAAQMQDGTPIPPGNWQIFSQTSQVAPHPSAEVCVPDGWVLVGGGAKANYTGLGSMLFASFPNLFGNCWLAKAKDHLQPDPATVTAFAIGLTQSFLDKAGVKVTPFQGITTSTQTNFPWATVVIPDFHLVSGGAQVNWAGVGNLLTASFPQDRQTWIARGKDHLQADQATITAVARGFVPVACKGLSIAAYFSPTSRPDLWDKIAASFPATQMIVFGPDNLTGVIADYLKRVQQMQGIGIRVFGYVNTVDTTTGIMIKSEDVKKNIDAYNHLYSVTDIMFDNAETITANIPYYQDLADYVHGQTPGSLVEMNASSSVLGTEEVPEAYMQFDDILAWFEGTYAQYFDPTFPNSKLMSWAKKYPSIRFKNYIHHVPDPSVIPSLLQRLIQNNTAFFHISDQTNPYVDLGTDQFWNALVPAVEATCPP